MNWIKALRDLFSLKKTEEKEIVKPALSGKITPDEARVINRFQQQFNLQFSDLPILATALKHRSYLNMTNESRTYSNERLEFLGDAVLDLVVTHFLYEKFPNKTEGYLSKVKSILVSKPVMADISVEMALGELVLMNRGEEKTGGRKRKSILADAFEAIIGAIFLDMGLSEAKKFIEDYLLRDYKKILRKGMYRNYKSILLEHAQSNAKCLLDYRVVKELGPDHAKEFVVEVWIADNKLGEGKGKSKKIAEQEAAKLAVRVLELEETH